MIARPDNWPELLDAHLREWSAYPFDYGHHDCVTFSATWLERLGYDQPLAGLPRWTCIKDAVRVWRALGGFQHAVQAQLNALGCERVPPAKAGRGDIVLVPAASKRRELLAIVTGREAAAHGGSGIVSVAFHESAMCAWRL